MRGSGRGGGSPPLPPLAPEAGGPAEGREKPRDYLRRAGARPPRVPQAPQRAHQGRARHPPPPAPQGSRSSLLSPRPPSRSRAPLPPPRPGSLRRAASPSPATSLRSGDAALPAQAGQASAPLSLPPPPQRRLDPARSPARQADVTSTASSRAQGAPPRRPMSAAVPAAPLPDAAGKTPGRTVGQRAPSAPPTRER